MTYQLRAGEILEALKRADALHYQEFKSMIEAATQGAAYYLADLLDGFDQAEEWNSE